MLTQDNRLQINESHLNLAMKGTSWINSSYKITVVATETAKSTSFTVSSSKLFIFSVTSQLLETSTEYLNEIPTL